MTTPASILAMLETCDLTLARCVALVLRTGDTIGFTDLDEDLRVYVEVLDSTVTFEAGAGLIVGDIDMAVGLAADNTEIRVPISASVTRGAVLGRRFNQADVYIFDVDHSQFEPIGEIDEIIKGRITESRIEGNEAVFEIRSASDLWNETTGSLLTPKCRTDYGSDLCGKTKIDIAATVSAIESTIIFTLGDLAGLYADQHFRFGDLIFTSGALLNVWQFEVLQFDGATGRVELLEPLPEPPGIGDGVFIRRGCSNLKRSDDPTIPTCLTYANVRRFRAWDRVPGSDVYVRMPIPGSPGA